MLKNVLQRRHRLERSAEHPIAVRRRRRARLRLRTGCVLRRHVIIVAAQLVGACDDARQAAQPPLRIGAARRSCVFKCTVARAAPLFRAQRVQNRSVPEGEVARSVLVVAVLRDRLGVARDARESIGDLNFDARADDNRSEIRDALDNLKKEKEKMSKPKRTKANNSGLGARRCAIESSVEPTDGERKGQRWPGRWSQTHVAVQVVRSVRAVLRKRRDNGDARC